MPNTDTQGRVLHDYVQDTDNVWHRHGDSFLTTYCGQEIEINHASDLDPRGYWLLTDHDRCDECFADHPEPDYFHEKPEDV